MTAAAKETVAEYIAEYEREWRGITKHVLFAQYGGVNSPERRKAYVARRLAEIRRSCTRYLHRPEFLALAEALDTAVIA